MNQTLPSAAPTGSASSATTPARSPGRLALISARWHSEIVHQARDAALAELDRSRWPLERVDQFELPGAFEIPLLAHKLARSGHYSGVMCCALIVNGGIYRHEFVSTAVIDGLMRVQLDTGVPVFSAVLTPRDFHEHAEHQRFFAEHFVKKGQELARACLDTLAAHEQVDRALAA